MMEINIFSLKNGLYEGTGVSLNCRTESGEITVLENHRPLISVLEKGTITITDGEAKEHYIPVTGGFLEIQNNIVRLIVEE